MQDEIEGFVLVLGDKGLSVVHEIMANVEIRGSIPLSVKPLKKLRDRTRCHDITAKSIIFNRLRPLFLFCS